MAKNKIKTPGYLIKRLKESGFIVIRLFNKYNDSDHRRWTIMVDPGDQNIMITCYENYPSFGEYSFEFNAGGKFWPRGLLLKTESAEVIIMELIKNSIKTYNKDNPFFKERIKELKNERT